MPRLKEGRPRCACGCGQLAQGKVRDKRRAGIEVYAVCGRLVEQAADNPEHFAIEHLYPQALDGGPAKAWAWKGSR